MEDRINAASSPLRFADGTEYQMSPLTDRDISELDEWVRVRFINLAMRSLPAETSEAERAAARMQATHEALTLTWMSGRGAQHMASVDGMTRLVWQSVKRNHPGVTEDELRRHLFSQENIAAVQLQFRRLNMPETNADPPRPARRRERKTRKSQGASRASRRSTGPSEGSTDIRRKR